MNKKEIAEIKKTLNIKNCCIDKVCACYVTPEKEKTIIPIQRFLSLPEEELFKYLDIFKKCLSGSIGKALNTLEFPLDSEKEDGPQAQLLEIRNDKLNDSDQVEELFDKIIENYETMDYYCILMMHSNYDIMTKGSDDVDQDESEEVFSHIIVAICPVALSKPGLAYNPDKNKLQDSIRNWIVDLPTFGFLFPAFRGRSTDIHATLTYTKKASSATDVLIDTILGCSVPISSDVQAEGFAQATQVAFDNQISFEQATAINSHLYDQIEEAELAENDGPILMDKASMKNMLETSKASNIESFDSTYDELFAKNDLCVENLIDKKKYVVKTDNITVTANPLYSSSISLKEIDGKKCIVIVPDGNIEVNGITTKSV